MEGSVRLLYLILVPLKCFRRRSWGPCNSRWFEWVSPSLVGAFEGLFPSEWCHCGGGVKRNSFLQEVYPWSQGFMVSGSLAPFQFDHCFVIAFWRRELSAPVSVPQACWLLCLPPLRDSSSPKVNINCITYVALAMIFYHNREVIIHHEFAL